MIDEARENVGGRLRLAGKVRKKVATRGCLR